MVQATGEITAKSDWPTVLTEEDGRLVFDGCDVEDLAAAYGTPTWVVSLPTVAENHRLFKEIWRDRYPHIECSYSLKANNTLAILRTLAEEGAYFDCSGAAEFEVVQRAGGAANKCILNGNGKDNKVLRMAVEDGCRQVNIDSIGEVERLAAIAQDAGTVVDCVVRVQLTYASILKVDPFFEPIVRIWEGKFGSSVESGEAMRIIEAVLASPFLRFAGLHHHVGFSGALDGYEPELEIMHHREALRELCEFALAVQEKTGVNIARLDLGGGFASGKGMYLASPGNAGDGEMRPMVPLERYADVISEIIREYFPEDALPILQFEAGRWHVTNAVVLLASVIDVKDGHSVPPRRFVSVDTNMYQFTTKGFTKLAHQAVVVNRLNEPAGDQLVDIVGQTCAYDGVVEDIHLPEDIAPDDLILFTSQGAYCDSSGSNFNAIPRPGTIAVENGKAALIKRRETVADVIARHSGPDLEWTQV